VNPQQLLGGLGVLLALAAPFGLDRELIAAAGAVLALLGALLLRPGMPPVAALVIGYQWLQVSAAVLYANARGQSLEQLYPLGDVVAATWLGLMGLTVATLVAGLFLRRTCSGVGLLHQSLLHMSIPRVLQAYIMLALVAIPMERALGVAGQLSQLVQAVGSLRWAALFLLLATALVQRRGSMLAAAIVLLEVVIGFSGFFAGFALPLQVAMLAFVSVYAFLRPHQRAAAGMLALTMLAMGVVWQGVKNEYRREVSGGTGEQVITVGLGERYALLGRMAGETVGDDLDRTFEKFALRLAYVENFGLVLRRVPAELPHTDGELLSAALAHILMPRVLFPDKPPLPSDSELTSLYTANIYIMFMTGTSISLGYMTELYIDFGYWGVALAGLLLAGILVGVHAGFQRAAADPALALALTCATLMSARLFETALPKLLGGVLSVFVVQLVLIVLLRHWLLPFLQGASTVPIRLAAVRE
jgi:hypothetical protein